MGRAVFAGNGQGVCWYWPEPAPDAGSRCMPASNIMPVRQSQPAASCPPGHCMCLALRRIIIAISTFYLRHVCRIRKCHIPARSAGKLHSADTFSIACFPGRTCASIQRWVFAIPISSDCAGSRLSSRRMSSLCQLRPRTPCGPESAETRAGHGRSAALFVGTPKRANHASPT